MATLAVVLAVGLASNDTAKAGPRDAASTHAYLVANFVFLRAVHANERTVNRNIAKLNRMLASQCPHVGAGAPQSEAAQHMSYEVAGALWFMLYRTDAKLVQTFVQAVRPLRWSTGSITHAAQAYILSLRELAALPSPNLCNDVRAWSASGFSTIPASTMQFDRHLEAIEGRSIPSRLLAPYEQSSDRVLAARDARLETQLEHTETVVGFDDWDMLLETLALNQ